MLNFDPILKIPLLAGQKLSKDSGKNIPVKYLWKMWYWLAKNLLGMSDQLEILHTSKLHHAEKKPQNNFLVWGAHHCENGIWKIQIFCEFFSSSKIFDVRFQGKCSTRPHILFTSCLWTAWTAIDFIFWRRLCSTRTQILFKSETAQLAISKYFVWNNETASKWGQWYKSGSNL